MKLQSLGCLTPFVAIGACLCLLSSLQGCGSDSGPSIVSQLVTRSAGGTVAYGTSASLTILANSLAADTTVTAQPAGSLPAAPSGKALVSGSAFAYGPDGTTLNPAGTLVLAYNPSGLGSVTAASLQVALVNGGAWQLLTSTVDTTAHTVSAQVSSFGTFALIGTVPTPTHNPADFAGNWAGRWVNTTFGSQNNATLAISVNDSAQTATITLQIFGNVLGTFTNPPAETYNGSWDATHFTITANSTIFGDATLSIDANGNLTGHANTTSNTRVSSVDLTGTADSQHINATYTVHFRDSTTATGTLTFTHS